MILDLGPILFCARYGGPEGTRIKAWSLRIVYRTAREAQKCMYVAAAECRACDNELMYKFSDSGELGFSEPVL